MARIPLIEKKESLSPEHQPIYDAIAQSRGWVRGPFSALLHSPALAERTARLGAYIRFESGLDPKIVELAALIAARELECRHEWAAHVTHAQKAGVSLATIHAIHKRKVEELDSEEARLVTYVQQLLHRHRVDEPVLQELLHRLGVNGLVELTATIGYYAMLACTLNAFDIAHVTPPEDLKI